MTVMFGNDEVKKAYLQSIAEVKADMQPSEVFAQLAEEAAELSQAASKTARILRGVNPTPVTLSESIDNVEEELADVELCVDILQKAMGEDDITMRVKMAEIKLAKLDRWIHRLREANKTEEPNE